MMKKSSRIAIVGAGPAGLTAARILRTRGVAVVVFDGEAATDARDQGGTLDLDEEGGQKALALAGLMDEFRARARYEDQETRVLDYATAAPLFEELTPPGSGTRPEIDRKMLRDVLLASLPPETVRWSHKLRSVQADGDGYRLHFAHGTSETFDFVVGADGAWSRVRASLSDVVPTYTGVTFVECWLDSVDSLHPALASLVGRGTMFAVHDNMGLVAQRNANAHIRVYAAFRRPLEWARDLGIDAAKPDEMRHALSSMFAGWSPQLLGLIEHALDVFVSRPIFALPVDFRWPSRPGMTLVGDAAHLMPPVGVGVNLAMLDAAELA